MSRPSSRMRPPFGVSKPASMRSSVVLPQPEGPSSAKNSFSRMSSETPSTAVTRPKFLRHMIDVEQRARLAHWPTIPRLSRCDRVSAVIADRHDDGRQRVDLRRDAEADHRIDLHRQRGRGAPGAGGEEGDDELVDRQREGEQRAGDHRRQDDRQGHAAEGGRARRRRDRRKPRRSTSRRLFSRARTTEQTKARLKTTWARMMVCRPMVTLSMEKNESSAIASTMSGMIIGAKISASSAVPRRCGASRCRSRAACRAAWRSRSRPAATISVLSAADRMSRIAGERGVPFQRKAGPYRRQPAFVEGQRHQHGDRDVEEGEDERQARARARAAWRGERSAIDVAPRFGSVARRVDRSAIACTIRSSIMMAISAMTAPRRTASRWRSGTGRRRGCRSSGSGRRRAAPA